MVQKLSRQKQTDKQANRHKLRMYFQNRGVKTQTPLQSVKCFFSLISPKHFSLFHSLSKEILATFNLFRFSSFQNYLTCWFLYVFLITFIFLLNFAPSLEVVQFRRIGTFCFDGLLKLDLLRAMRLRSLQFGVGNYTGGQDEGNYPFFSKVSRYVLC